MPRRICLVAALLTVVGCAGPRAETTTVPPTSVATETTTSTTVADHAALCNGYLVLLETGDPSALRPELQGEELADLETMLSTEGEFEAIAAAALRLEEAVVARCADRFSLSVEPAADNATALTTFLEALRDGDEEAASVVAWENVVAQFNWTSNEGGDIELEGDTATMPLGTTASVTCEAQQGVVVRCRFDER